MQEYNASQKRIFDRYYNQTIDWIHLLPVDAMRENISSCESDKFLYLLYGKR